MKGILIGIVVTLAVLLAGAFVVVRSGLIPANADAAPGRIETWLASTSLDATLQCDATGDNPVPLTTANLVEGVHLFGRNCAVCHGSAQGDAAASPIARGLYQKPPQFASEGVEDDPEAMSFWKVKHGIRMTGMPSFRETLRDRDIWTIALFLKHMDKLPRPAQQAWQQVRNWPVAAPSAGPIATPAGG
jgi:mono/diheme cytochrome c family protein